MFGTFKEKFQSVQDGITASFRGLAVGEPIKSRKYTGGNLNAGAMLLEKYQNYWQDMHSIAEGNAKLAQRMDAEIHMLLTDVTNRYRSITLLEQKLDMLPKLITETELIVNNIGEMRSTIENIEQTLLHFEKALDIEVPNAGNLIASNYSKLAFGAVTPGDDVSALLESHEETDCETKSKKENISS